MSAVQETRIYVGNISPDTTKVALKEAFEKVGAVSKLRVLQRRRKTIVYAFITFEAAADAKKAIGDLNETELDGNKILVQEARPIDDEVLAQRKENKKKNRKLKRQAQQQAKKETEVTAKKEGDDTKTEETQTAEETKTETKPKKKSNRKRKAKKEEGSGNEEDQPESTKKDAPATTKKSPEPSKKEVNKEEDTKKEEKKSAKPEVKKDEKKEDTTAEKKKGVDNKAKSANKQKSEEKAVKPEEKKGEAKDGESKSSRISPETGVFVANLPFSAKTADLQELFKDFNIKTAKIARGGYRSKGYGFVEAATVEDQQKILKEFKEVEFKERIITVKPLLSKGDDE